MDTATLDDRNAQAAGWIAGKSVDVKWKPSSSGRAGGTSFTNKGQQAWNQLVGAGPRSGDLSSILGNGGQGDQGLGYGYGYGGGGGGGDNYSTPSDMQKETAKNLRPIIHYNYDTLDKKFDLGDKVYDTADEQSENTRRWQDAIAQRNATDEWYRINQKLHSTEANLRSEMGTAAYGTDFHNLYDLIARTYDQSNDDTLQALRKNQDEIDANYYDALMNNVNSRNKLAADTEISTRELGSDWAAQLNNINPQLANGEYQAGVTGMGESRKEGKAPDDAGDFDSLIDRKNDTLKFPDWLKTDYANDHWSQAINPEMRPFYRPDLAAQTASDMGLRNRNTNTASAATRKSKGIASYLQPYSANSMNRRTQ